jgi:23S rRNA (pseudouridine1915-N3)-methyltransferase
MRLKIVSVGRDRSGLFEPAVQEYAKRLNRYLTTELVEVADSDQPDDPRGREEESAAILKRLKHGDRLWLLDEHGKALDSLELARLLGQALTDGKDVALAIGGAAGHGEGVRKRSERSLSLSRLTLAHRLARVVLMEQLYRAMTILRGEPYHRG